MCTVCQVVAAKSSDLADQVRPALVGNFCWSIVYRRIAN